MLKLPFNIVPETGGGIFTGARNSPAGLNTPRWAKIVDVAGEAPARYGWEEQTFQALAPGEKTSIGFAKADAGIVATPLLNPIIEPNRRTLAVGDYCLVRAEYFDPVYDTVFVPLAGTGTGGVAFAKNLESTATDGRYAARLQEFNLDGTLRDMGADVWLRDCNNRGALTAGIIYLCGLTGNTLGRPVYTTMSQAFDVLDEHTGTLFTTVYAIVFRSSFTDFTDADPAYGDWIIQWYDESQRTLVIKLNGYSGNQDFLTRCEGGQLRKRNMLIRNGLTKVLGPEGQSGS